MSPILSKEETLSRVVIALTGDIYPTRPLTPLPAEVRAVFDILRNADVAVGNFEISLTDKGAPLEKLLAIRANPEVVRDLPELGLDVVTVANNHAIDYGWDALRDSMDRLQATGLRVVGAGSTVAEAMQPTVVTVDGARIGIIAFSCLLPAGMAAAPNRPGLSPIHVHSAYEIDSTYQMEEPGELAIVKVRTWPDDSDLRSACDAVRSLKSECDFAIVSIHWGFGSGEQLADYQWPVARALIDAGADAIHGHHPHAIHPVGYYCGKPVLFSPNVLVGQQVFLPASPQVQKMWSEMSTDGYVACLVLTGQGVEIELAPIVLDSDRLPRHALGADRRRIFERLERLSKAHGARITDNGERIAVMPA